MSQSKERRAMIKDLALLRQAGALARHAAARHAVVAENMANADTPGYKARDLPAFDSKIADAAKNNAPGLERRMLRPTVLQGMETSPDGNTVNLADQMTRGADAQAQHAAALTVYRKAIELMRLSVSTR